MKAIPIPALGLKLDDMSARIACGLRLRSPLCQPHTCQCGVAVDSLGRYGLCCRKAEGRHSRHSQVNDLLKRALASAQIPSIREPPGLSRDDGRRPDGLTLLPWSSGRSVVWDYTCSDTLAPSHVSSTSKGVGKSAEQAEKRSWPTMNICKVDAQSYQLLLKPWALAALTASIFSNRLDQELQMLQGNLDPPASCYKP